MNFPSDYAYLRAMGITVWVPRELHSPETTAYPHDTGDTLFVKARTLQVSEYLQALSTIKVASMQTGTGKVLLLVEPPSLTDPDLALLGKMLVAIGLQIESQGIAAIDVAGDSLLPGLIASQRPALLLAMICCGGSPTTIENYRASHHRLSWCGVPIAFTHHPAKLNHQSELKRPAWEDLKRVKAVLDGQ